MCACNQILVYHYYLATRTYERFSKFVNGLDYKFATIDTSKDLKVLKNSSIACQNLVDNQG